LPKFPDIVANLPTDASTSATAQWQLRLCGQAQAVSEQGRRQTLERRDAALLALLAIAGPTARSNALALLSPEEAPEQVRGRLRQRIHVLKRRLGVEAVEGSHTLALGAALSWPGFDQEPPGTPLIGADEHADMPEFAQWLQVARNQLQTQRRERFAAQAAELEQPHRSLTLFSALQEQHVEGWRPCIAAVVRQHC
jgi:hypothetical protein